MAAKKSQTASPIFPMQELFTSMTEQHMQRLTSAFSMWEDLEKKSIDQSTQFINEYARMSKASIDYCMNLNQQLRETALSSIETVGARA